MAKKKLKKRLVPSRFQRRDRPPQEAFALVTHIFEQLSLKERSVVEVLTEKAIATHIHTDRAIVLMLDAMTVRMFWGDNSFPMMVRGKAEVDWMTSFSELMTTQKLDAEETAHICIAIMQGLVHSELSIRGMEDAKKEADKDQN